MAAEEWVEVEAGRDPAREAEAREREARAEAEGRVRAEDCGKAALVEVRVAARGAVDLAAAQVQVVEDLEAADRVQVADRAAVLAPVEVQEVAAQVLGQVLVRAGAEVGGREAARVLAVEERVRV